MAASRNRPWAATLSDTDDVPDYDYFDPSCQCGGGAYLGNIRTVAMYENHRSIDCIKNPRKTPMPYISPSYFNVLKEFEKVTRDLRTNYMVRLSNLLLTWKMCHCVLSSDPCSGTHVFMHYASCESALLILDPGWKEFDDTTKNEFSLVLEEILKSLQIMESHPDAIRSCTFLLSIMKKPWSHNNLLKLLNGNPSLEEVSDLIQFEGSSIFALRLRMLCEGQCETQALKLSSLAMCLYNFELKSKHHIEENDFEFIRDIYYACLERSNKKKELIEQLKKFTPKNDGQILMQKYCNKIQSLSKLQKESRPRICKSIVVVCEMAACILVATSLQDPDCCYDDFSKLMKRWSLMMVMLMESDIENDMNDLRIKDMIHTFIDMAPTASHLYLLCDILSDVFGSKLPQTLYIEIYIKALATNLNEKERCRQMNDKNGSFDALKKLVQGYLKLANLLEDVLSVCRECVLTAYSLMPSSDLMARVESLAIKSGKLFPKHQTNVPEYLCDKHKRRSTTNIKSDNSNKIGRKRKNCKACKIVEVSRSIFGADEDNYNNIHRDLNNLPDPLPRHANDDLIAVLKYPRFTTFNWNLEWPRMKIMCQHYLDNFDMVLQRNTLQRSDLKFLDIDIDQYNKATEEKMRTLTNDKGYFSSDNSSDDEQSVTSVASSGESVGFTIKFLKTRTRRRKVGLRGGKIGSQKRKVHLSSKQRKLEKQIKSKGKQPIQKKIDQNQTKVGFQKRRNLRSQRGFEVTDESTVGPLLNDKIQSKNQNLCNEVEDNSIHSVIEVKSKKRNVNSRKKCKPQQIVPREKRVISKNQHKDFDYSWSIKKKGKLNNDNNEVQEFLENSSSNSSIKKEFNYVKTTSKVNSLNVMGNSNFDIPHSSKEHLNMLSERIPQLSSLDFIRPAITDHIVNVVQIQTTSNTNVSQTQTEHISNHHSNNEIQKKTNDSQTNTHPLGNFVSLYQSNSLNSSMNSIQNSALHQGECSFTGSVSVSNQKITADSITNVQNIGQQGTSKPVGTHDNMFLDQNQVNLDHRRWNDTQVQNSDERLQSIIENNVQVSSNVIVRTSDVVNPSQVTQNTGQLTNTTKKPTFCVKTRDRFIDLSLPASISSISTNSNRSTNTLVVMNSSHKSKVQQNSPVQTSVGLQVNFSNQQSDNLQSMMSSSNKLSQICTNITENSTSTVLNDQTINSINSRISTSSIVNTSFIKEINAFDNLKSNLSTLNPVSSIQTQTGVEIQTPGEGSNPSVLSLKIASTQSQVIKSNVHNSLYTTSQNTDSSHTSLTSKSDEQKKIDNLKLLSQTFTATSEAIKFVTSSSESQRLIQSTEKTNSSNLAVYQNAADGVLNIKQENDLSSKSSSRGRGNIKSYESKTRALKQANMSDMFVFEKGTLYAVHDDVVSHVESSKMAVSPKTITTSNVKIQNKQAKELLEKQKPSPNASPNITITGSMLPRFQQVFGKTKFQSASVINDTQSVQLCSTSVTNNSSASVTNNSSASMTNSSSASVTKNSSANVTSSNTSNPVSIINRTNTLTSRVYSSSKGVQTNHDIDPISPSTMNCLTPKILDNKLNHNVTITKGNNIRTIGNHKNNVIMTCKTVSSVKNIPQMSAKFNHRLITSNIDTNTIKKEGSSLPITKFPTTFTSSCNSLIASSGPNVVYSTIQSDSKATNSVDKSPQTIQRQIRMSPSIIQTVLRKHPNWQQNCFLQSKQSTEVQTVSGERLTNVSDNVKTTIESVNHKVSISASKSNVTEPNVSSSMMEQVREFESVLEEVRKTSLLNEMSTAIMLPQINHEIIQIHSPTENVDLLDTDSSQTLFPLNKKLDINNGEDRCSFSFLNQTLSNAKDVSSEEKEQVAEPSVDRSVTPTPSASSQNINVSVNPVEGSVQCPKQIANKVKPVIKTPASSPSTSAVKVPVLQKPLPKLQEDEQTTQRIYAILDKYAEQLRNSPELKNKPAPRRRTNPPTNPNVNPKRKKSNQLNLKTCSQQTSCSSSGMEMSPTSDMQAIDSEDSCNAVSHFSHINSPSRNSDELTTVITETQIENALINVNEVIKKINVEAEMKSKVSQSTQIVVSGSTGSFLSIPEGSAGNVRLLLAAAGKNQKMYRLHCPGTGPGPVLFHQITTKDSSSNEVGISSNILGQNINESTILSTLTTDDMQIANSGLGNDIVFRTSQNSKVFEHKVNKSDIISESMEKAQVHGNYEKQLQFPIMKRSQASQSTFSVIHSLPSKHKSEQIDKTGLLSETKNIISENTKKNFCDNEQTILNIKQEPIDNSDFNNIVLKQQKLNKNCREEPLKSLKSNSFESIAFSSFHSQGVKQENDVSCINQNITQQSMNSDKTSSENSNTNQILIGRLSNNKTKNDPNNLNEVKCENVMDKQEKLSAGDVSSSLDCPIVQKEEKKENKSNVVLSDVATASAAEIISTANHTSNTYKQKEELLPKTVKAECESENENENTLSNTVYSILDNQSSTNINTKIGSLTLCLKNNMSSTNWNNCLSKIIPPGTEKLLEGENLKQLQESFLQTEIKTFKDLKIFVFEQCKKFDNNVETPNEYDLYDDIDGLGVDKPSTNELFPEVAILNDLDKSVSPTLSLLSQATTSKSNDTALQVRRKSVLSHTTSPTVITSNVEQTTSVVCKKNKTKVSFLKQALYNEMNQDSNDCDTKPFINGSSKIILDSMDHIDSSPESPSNTAAVDSETCMSEDSTSTISSGTPHYNFRKSKRKNIEEDGFIESQVIKRMYRGRTSEDNEDKSDLHKINSPKLPATEQKPTIDKKESNNRRISSRLKNNNVKSNSHSPNKSPQLISPPFKITTTRTSLRRVSRKTTN